MGLLDSDSLKALLAQFAPGDDDTAAARKRAIMMLGFGMMGARKGNELQSIGNAGIGAVNSYNDSLDNARRTKLAQVAGASGLLGLQGQMQNTADDQQYRQVRMNQLQPQQPTSVTPPPVDGVGPPAPQSGTNVPRISTSKMSDYERAIADAQYLEAKGVAPKYVEQAYAKAEKLRPQFDQTPRVGTDANGARYLFVLDKDGNEKRLGASPDKEKAVQVNTGNKTVFADPFSGNIVPGGAVYEHAQSPDSAASNAVTMRGQDMTNARAKDALAHQGKPQIVTGPTGEILAVDPRSATGVEVTGPDGKPLSKGQKLTEQQANATAFGMRMKASHDIIKGLEQSGYDTGSPKNLLATNAVTNYAASPEAQSLYQAKLNFMTASLRKESGAAISKSEFDSENKKYFAQPGDAPKTIEQKRQARELALKAMVQQAGPGASQISGDSGWSIKRVP